MIKKREQEPVLPPNLIISREDALDDISHQINIGKELNATNISTEEDLEKANAGRIKWSDYNRELLTRIFDNKSIADEYLRSGYSTSHIYLKDKIIDFHEYIKDKTNKLDSILSRIDLIPVINTNMTSVLTPIFAPVISRKVFVVHGHDEEMKQSVARLLENLDLDPIILHEKPDQGKTVIEKFTDYSDVCYAIVLLSPDDVAYPKTASYTEAKPRARQNVIFELGYFLGKLSRKNVLVLYRDETNFEMPTDYSGVLFKKYDTEGSWKLKLVQELNACGIKVDANKLLAL